MDPRFDNDAQTTGTLPGIGAGALSLSGGVVQARAPGMAGGGAGGSRRARALPRLRAGRRASSSSRSAANGRGSAGRWPPTSASTTPPSRAVMPSSPTRRPGYACSTIARSTASWSMAAASSGARWSTATSSTIGRHTLYFLDTVSTPTVAPPESAGGLDNLRPRMAADTIAVLSLKGGTGKTTTVRTLADVLRRVGLDVLAVDLDPQGNLSDYFDVPPDASPTRRRRAVGRREGQGGDATTAASSPRRSTWPRSSAR